MTTSNEGMIEPIADSSHLALHLKIAEFASVMCLLRLSMSTKRVFSLLGFLVFATLKVLLGG
jgi:hypothetical protein